MQDISEEGYDRMRDRRLEQGTWRSASSDKPRSGGTQPKMKGKTVLQKQADKKYGAGTSAMDRVKADITAKYGKGAIMNTKKEEVEQVDENRAAMGRINKEYHRKKEAEAMAARSRDPKVKRDLPKRKNDNPMYDPKSAGSSRVKGFKFTGEEVETIEEKRKGLWANIHAKRKRGEKPAKPGDKDYPKTLNVEGYDKPDEKLKTDRDMFNIPKEKQNAAKERLLAKAKAKRAKLKEDVWDQVDIFAEMNDWEISLLNDTIIEDIITDVFIEELQEGRDIDSVTDMLCESVDYSLNLLTEVSDSYYDSAVKSSKAASRTPEVRAANRRAKLDKVKSAAKKVGSALKSGLKTGAKLARKGAVKGAEVAGKAAGHAKNLAKDMGSAAKKGYQSTQSSSSSSDSDSSSSSSDSSSSSSSSSSESKPKKPGLLSRIGSKLKRGIKKAVGAGARSLSRGARNVARRLGEETITERGDFWHPDPDEDRKLGGPGANQRAREDRAAASKPAAKKADPKKLRKGESYMDYAKRQKGYTPPKKKEGLRDKIKRKLGMKREEVTTMSFSAFLAEGNRTGRMMHKSKTQVTGHISADRGSDEKKNREGRKSLEKDLKKHGIGHKKGVGEYKYDSGETGREVSYQTSKPDKMSKRRFGKVMRRMGRKHGQESVITKDKDKPAKLHYTEKGSKAKSDTIGKTKAGKHPQGYGETSGTKARGGKLPKKTNKSSYHYG